MADENCRLVIVEVESVCARAISQSSQGRGYDVGRADHWRRWLPSETCDMGYYVLRSGGSCSRCRHTQAVCDETASNFMCFCRGIVQFEISDEVGDKLREYRLFRRRRGSP